MIVRNRTLWNGVLLLLLLPAVTSAEDRLFSDSDVVQMQITGPLGSLIRNKEVRKESPFLISVGGEEHNVHIRVRGKSRARVCDFPPLRLDFTTNDVAETLFDGQDKLKLVTHCRNYDRAEADMLQEYVAYRVFNAITPISYRVRLLRIHYVDTDKRLGKKAANRYAFLIESSSEMAARIDAKRTHAQSVMRGTLDEDYAALVFVFQYLIANTDWSLVLADGADECCHNIDLFEGTSGVLLVPYDLDLAGVVNARYAYPDKSLRISRVTQRLYRGMCMDREQLRSALQHIKSLQSEILGIPGSTPGLKPHDVSGTQKYLEKFFIEAEDEDRLLDRFAATCVKPRYRTVK